MTFDRIFSGWAVCRGIIQGETGPGAVVAHLNGVEPGGPDWKSRRRMKIMDEGFYTGQIVGDVCLQGCLVSILRHDREIVRCGGKSNAPEARTFCLSPPREDRQVFWFVDNDLAFGKDDFTVGIAHGPKTDKCMLEQSHEFA